MIRVLITSTSHPNYDQTGLIVSDKKEEGVEIKLDLSEEVVLASKGQWKAISRQESAQSSKGALSSDFASITIYSAVEGVVSVLGEIIDEVAAS